MPQKKKPLKLNQEDVYLYVQYLHVLSGCYFSNHLFHEPGYYEMFLCFNWTTPAELLSDLVEYAFKICFLLVFYFEI